MKKKMILPIIAAAALLSAGCVSYSASPTYVGFASDGVKTVQQTKKTKYDSREMFKTFDDEFVYDEEGNVIKHIQTQYFEDAKKFDEYEITYQKIGGVVLPKSAAINGVVYMEVEYDLMPVEHEGKIPEYTSIPVFYRKITNLLAFEPNYVKWSMDMGNFDVPFRIDEKFVESEESFDFYSGFDNDHVLTTGYDKILLQKFFYSRDKFHEGYNLTLDSAVSFLNMFSEKEINNTAFLFDWDVKAGKLIQTNVHVVETSSKMTMTFNIDREFDESARLTSEKWTVSDTKQRSDDPITLFEQKLTY